MTHSLDQEPAVPTRLMPETIEGLSHEALRTLSRWLIAPLLATDEANDNKRNILGPGSELLSLLREAQRQGKENVVAKILAERSDVLRILDDMIASSPAPVIWFHTGDGEVIRVNDATTTMFRDIYGEESSSGVRRKTHSDGTIKYGTSIGEVLHSIAKSDRFLSDLNIHGIIDSQESLARGHVGILVEPEGMPHFYRMIGSVQGHLGQIMLFELSAQEAMQANLRLLIQGETNRAIEIISAFTRAEAQDTAQHLERVGANSYTLADYMRTHYPAYQLSETDVAEIGRWAPMHDIGKILLDPETLLKAEKLTPTEWNYIKAHVPLGVHFLEKTGAPHIACDIADYHHSRFDGREDGFKKNPETNDWQRQFGGYGTLPLTGHDIPISASIVQVTDAIDAMLSRRSYKEGLPPDEVKNRLQQNAGKQFNPDAVEAALAIFDTFVTQK